jgi:hypothetical protein
LLTTLQQTHAPHNDNDEPIDEFVTLLDPVRLLTLVPRNIGFSVAEAYDVVNDKLLAASKADRFIINFSQFYMMLLRMTQIVYGELFEKDSTLAFAKILQVGGVVLLLVLSPLHARCVIFHGSYCCIHGRSKCDVYCFLVLMIIWAWPLLGVVRSLSPFFAVVVCSTVLA